MVQTENVDGDIVDGDNVEIRPFDECLDIYKTQVNIKYFYDNIDNLISFN